MHTDDGSGVGVRGGGARRPPLDTAIRILALFGRLANLALVGHFATHNDDGSEGGGWEGGRVAPFRHCYVHPSTVRLPCQPNTTLLLFRSCRALSLDYTPHNYAFLPFATLLYAGFHPLDPTLLFAS